MGDPLSAAKATPTGFTASVSDCGGGEWAVAEATVERIQWWGGIVVNTADVYSP